MANREIYKVFATQIVVSESNPQDVLSDVSILNNPGNLTAEFDYWTH